MTCTIEPTTYSRAQRISSYSVRYSSFYQNLKNYQPEFHPLFSARAISTVWPTSRKRLIMQLWKQWTLTTRHIQIQTVFAHRNHTPKCVIGRDFKKSQFPKLLWYRFKISDHRGRVERRARQFQTMLKNVFDTSATQIELGRPCLTGFGQKLFSTKSYQNFILTFKK